MSTSDSPVAGPNDKTRGGPADGKGEAKNATHGNGSHAELPNDLTDEPSKTQEQREEKKQQQPVNQPLENPDMWHWRRDNTRLVVEVLALGFLIATVFYTAAQFREMQIQNQIMIGQFQAEKRAWLELDNISPVPISGDAGLVNGAHTFRYPLRFKNTGSTAARNIRLRVFTPSGERFIAFDKQAIHFLIRQLADKPDIPGVDPLPGLVEAQTLGPGSITPVAIQTVMTTVQGGRLYSYLVGKVDYADAFGSPHWMTFCFTAFASDGSLQYCKYGNDEDESTPAPAPPK